MINGVLPVSKKNKVEAIIGGNVYVLQGRETQEYMQQVALYIDRKMNEIKKSDMGNRMSTSQIAMLTSINVADDLFKLKEELKEREKQLQEQDLENSNFYNEFEKLEKENMALKEKISQLQLELTKARM